MSKVILDMAMSLDGFISGLNDSDSGLHDYFFSPSSSSAAIIEASIKNTGVIIMGRGAYEIGAKYGGFKDSPYDAANIVVTRQKPEVLAEGAESFIFVDSIEKALEEARKLAGTKDIIIGGGAAIAQSFLESELLDEILIAHIPIIIGQGKRLFVEGKEFKLEKISLADAPDVTHTRYKVVRQK